MDVNDQVYSNAGKFALYFAWFAATCYFVFKLLMDKSWSKHAVSEIKTRQQKARESFDKFQQIVDDGDLEDDLVERILSLSFNQLRESLQSGELSPTQVHLAYAQQILKVNEEVNCVTDCIVESVEIARKLELKYANGEEKPYLYGVPFSVKSNFFVKGYDCSMGLAKFANIPKTENCSFVDILLKLGGVPICITNVPQGLMSFMCSNPIFGTTHNPYRKDFTPGGSSGGEACLVAKRGIPFGIGSDLAGSLRIPAHMSGVVSMKPAESRFAITNSHGGMPGKCRIGLSFGFFTHSVDEQIELFDLVLNSEIYKHLRGPTSALQKFEMEPVEAEFERGLRIGYYTSNGFLEPVPACARAVREVIAKIDTSKHELVEFAIPEPQKMANLVLNNIASDGFVFWKKMFQNEKLDPYMKQFVYLLKVPYFVKRLVACMCNNFSPQFALMCRTGVYSASDIRELQEETDNYKLAFFKQWRELKLDAVIAPAFAVTSVPQKYPSQLGLAAIETALYNVLDCAAGVVPVTKVSAEDVRNLNDEAVFRVGWNLTKSIMRKSGQGTEGLPVGVQIITRPFEEEKCLRVMKYVEELIKE